MAESTYIASSVNIEKYGDFSTEGEGAYCAVSAHFLACGSSRGSKILSWRPAKFLRLDSLAEAWAPSGLDTILGMPTVFLSSVVRGFEDFRDAAATAIDGLDGFKCIRMERFSSDAQAPLDTCLKHLRTCDYYVGIVGAHYGSVHEGARCSYTEAEYNEAVKLGIPRLIFLATVDTVGQESDELATRQREFRKRVSAGHFRSEFRNAESLSAEISKALANSALRGRQVHKNAGDSTWLFVPFVTAQAGYDSGIAITNPDLSRLGFNSRPGKCTIYYVGNVVGEPTTVNATEATANARPSGARFYPIVQESAVVPEGNQLMFMLTTGGNYGIEAAPGFQGYLLIHCGFPNARGVGYLGRAGDPLSGFVPVEVIPAPVESEWVANG